MLKVALCWRVDLLVNNSLLRVSFILHLYLARGDLFTILALIKSNSGAFRCEASRCLNDERLLSSTTDSQVLLCPIVPLNEVLGDDHLLLRVVFVVWIDGTLSGVVLESEIAKLLRIVQRLRRLAVLALRGESLRDFLATRPFLYGFMVLCRNLIFFLLKDLRLVDVDIVNDVCDVGHSVCVFCRVLLVKTYKLLFAAAEQGPIRTNLQLSGPIPWLAIWELLALFKLLLAFLLYPCVDQRFLLCFICRSFMLTFNLPVSGLSRSCVGRRRHRQVMQFHRLLVYLLNPQSLAAVRILSLELLCANMHGLLHVETVVSHEFGDHVSNVMNFRHLNEQRNIIKQDSVVFVIIPRENGQATLRLQHVRSRGVVDENRIFHVTAQHRHILHENSLHEGAVLSEQTSCAEALSVHLVHERVRILAQ